MSAVNFGMSSIIVISNITPSLLLLVFQYGYVKPLQLSATIRYFVLFLFSLFFLFEFSLQSFYYLIFKFTDCFLSYVQAPDDHMEGISVGVYF